MAIKNESCSSIADLIGKLDTYLATRGWTAEWLDVTADAGVGGEWAMRKSNVRFATSWDAENSGTVLAIYQYSDQNYVESDRPWGQDHDSGNGYAATTPDASIDNERSVLLSTTPIQYWAFDNNGGSSVYMHIVVESSTGVYVHFGFGELDKRGDWVGGEYCYGQKDNNSPVTGGQANFDNISYMIDGFLNDTAEGGGVSNNSELWAATIRCVSLPSQPANGMWAVSVGGKSFDGPQIDFGTDRQSNDGSSPDVDRVMFIDGLRAGAWATGFSRTSGIDIGGELRMWPIAPRYIDPVDFNVYGPMGLMPNVHGCMIPTALAANTIYTDEDSIDYHIFPANRLYVSPTPGTSGYLGVAYEISPYVDPGLPAGLPTVTGHYSMFDSDDYTLSGAEIVVLNDLSGNDNHLTPHSGKTGPDVKTIDGRTWAEFPAAEGRLMSVTNPDTDPGSGDFSMVAVFRATYNGSTGSVIMGKIGVNDPHYGLFVGISNQRSLYYQHRDNGTGFGAIDVVHHDDASHLYLDGTTRQAAVVFDTSANTLKLYGASFSTVVDTDDPAAEGTIGPSNDLFFGDWGTSFNRKYEGEIAEVLFFSGTLTGSQLTNLQGYLQEKWGYT